MLRIILCCTLITFFISTQAQVGIGTTTPAGALDIVSTTGGLIPPRMTTGQRDSLTSSNRPTGATIYNTTTQCLQINKGTATLPTWTCLDDPEISKLTYSSTVGDSSKIITLGGFRFRFAQGALTSGGAAPQMALVSNPGSTITYNFNSVQNGGGYSNTPTTFTNANYSTFQKILGSGDYMTNNEVNEIYFTDTNNRYYHLTFYVSTPSVGNNVFVIIVERF